MCINTHNMQFLIYEVPCYGTYAKGYNLSGLMHNCHAVVNCVAVILINHLFWS